VRSSIDRQPARHDVSDRDGIGGWTPAADDLLADFDDDRVEPEVEPVPQDVLPPLPASPPDARTSHSTQRPLGRLARRWVPESLIGSRMDPGRRGALLLTFVAALAAIVAAVGVWRDRPEPRPVQAVSLTQVSTQIAGGATATGSGRRSASSSSVASRSSFGLATVAASPLPTPAQGGPLVVSVTGAVRRPGLLRLTAGSRVADAIAKAGGTTGRANLTGLNLAEKLSDGASVVVSDVAESTSSVAGAHAGPTGQPGSGVGSASRGAVGSGGKLDLNTADVAALDALPGVGPVTAAAVVAWRNKNGKFNSVEQLQEISGIGPAKFAGLSQLVKV